MSAIIPHPLHGANRFKLGVFSANADGGLTLTKVPERWDAKWENIVAAAQIADKAGIDFFLPIARWKGFKGDLNAREHSFETFSFAAALSGVTERMALFSTVHVPMVHPVFAAKALATVDHASNGRAGLNIVAGWNPDEFAMFGIERHDRAYEQALEWYRIVEKLLVEEEPFDYDGTYYHLKQAISSPKSLQRPRPVTLNAAFGPPGRDFAAQAADYLFTTFSSIEKGKEHIEDMRGRSQKTGRDVGVYTTCHVVCRANQKEAEDYYQYYTVDMVDEEALDYHVAQKQQFANSYDEETFRLYRQRFAGGTGTYPLIGTPDKIAEEMVLMSEAGFAGTTVSFVNFTNELPYFTEEILPRLQKAGLREA